MCACVCASMWVHFLLNDLVDSVDYNLWRLKMTVKVKLNLLILKVLFENVKLMKTLRMTDCKRYGCMCERQLVNCKCMYVNLKTVWEVFMLIYIPFYFEIRKMSAFQTTP